MKAAMALLAELDDDDLAEVANRLAPHLAPRLQEQLLTPAEAAKVVRMHPKSLTRAAADGRVIGSVRVGHGWRFRASALEILPPTQAPITPMQPARTPRARSTTPTSAAVDAIRGARAAQ